jgi:hypothetical protein
MNIREKIIDKYTEHIFGLSSIKTEKGYHLFKSFFGTKFDTILEIGSCRGASACLLSEHAEKVITIDIKEYEDAINYEELGITNVEHIVVKNNIEKTKIIKELEFDFAYIDGAHDEGVFLDWFLVKKCKRVLFHDYSDWAFHYMVNLLVDSLPENEVTKHKPFAYWEGK